MEIALGIGALVYAGNSFYQETYYTDMKKKKKTDIVSVDPEKDYLKIPPSSNPTGRENLFEKNAQDLGTFPGTSRIRLKFRKVTLRSREEVEHDNSEPLVQNVKSTQDVNFRGARDRYHIKRENYKDALGRIPETWSTGVEVPDKIWRMERLAQHLGENTKAIANRALLPKTKKQGDAFYGRVLAISVMPSLRQGPSKRTAGEVPVWKNFLEGTRVAISSQFPKGRMVRGKMEKAVMDRTIENPRMLGGARSDYKDNLPMVDAMVALPRRSDPYLENRRPNVNYEQHRHSDPIRALEIPDSRKKQEEADQNSRPIPYWRDQNQQGIRSLEQSESRIKTNNDFNAPFYVTATDKLVIRPKDITQAGRNGTKILTENRDPVTQNNKVVFPIIAVERDHQRSGHRELS